MRFSGFILLVVALMAVEARALTVSTTCPTAPTVNDGLVYIRGINLVRPVDFVITTIGPNCNTKCRQHDSQGNAECIFSCFSYGIKLIQVAVSYQGGISESATTECRF